MNTRHLLATCCSSLKGNGELYFAEVELHHKLWLHDTVSQSTSVMLLLERTDIPIYFPYILSKARKDHAMSRVQRDLDLDVYLEAGERGCV